MNTTNNLNIALYARVSTDGQTLDPQWLELRAYAARQGWSVAAEFSDVLSGAKAARPGLDALRSRVAEGDVEAVVVVKLDRLGRSLLNVVRLVEELDAMDVAVICTSQGIDTRKDSPCGRMILQIMASFSEFERSIISERTVSGLAAAKARGRVLGKPSAALIGRDVPGTVAEWRAGGRVGGLRGLAARLGGCSVSTAHRLAKVPAVVLD